MAVLQKQLGQQIGYLAEGFDAGMDTFTLDSSTKRMAFAFIPSETKTLSKVRVYFHNVTGTPASTDIAFAIQADSSGNPSNTDLESKTISASPSATAYNEATSFTTSCTGGTRYWIVIKNTHGTPASNNVQLRFPYQGTRQPFSRIGQMGQQAKWGWGWGQSTDGGSTYSTVSGLTNIRLEFSDGSIIGIPVTDCAALTGGSEQIYSAREAGALVTIPATWPTLNVIGISMPIGFVGTAPAGGLRFRLYTGASPSLLATTQTVPADNVGAGYWVHAHFSSVQAIAAGTVLRVVAGAVSGGDSSNFYYTSAVTIENAAASKALTPFGSTQFTYNNSGWTETDTKVPGFALHLDTNGDFTVAGGGGRLIL